MHVRRIQREVARRDDGHADHQCARDDLLRLARLAGRVGDHVPSAVGEEAGHQGQDEIAERRRRRGSDDENQQRHDPYHLDDGEERLHRAPLPHADVIDDGE